MDLILEYYMYSTCMILHVEPHIFLVKKINYLLQGKAICTFNPLKSVVILWSYLN